MIDSCDSKPLKYFRAFTMIEIVMVVAIIALLAAITIRVGASMADSGRIRATEGVLQVLDQALDDYISSTGSIPSALVEIKLQEQIDTQDVGDIVYYPAIDGVLDLEIPRDDPDSPLRHYKVNSVGLFLASIKHASDIGGLTSQIDSSLIRMYDVDDQSTNTDEDLQPEMLTVFDAWGNPIRYVHPKFDGVIEDSVNQADRRQLGEPGDFLDVFDVNLGFFTAEYRPQDLELPFVDVRRNKILQVDQEEARSVGGSGYPIETDSDGGTCPTQRPYFYSAGPDGDPSTTDDNVYTTVPEFIDPL